jgi:DNA-binding transcriptional regulator YdaS (Cro superfamily)
MCVTEGAVSHWVKAGAVPPGAAVNIEKAMRGRVKAVDLIVSV